MNRLYLIILNHFQINSTFQSNSYVNLTTHVCPFTVQLEIRIQLSSFSLTSSWFFSTSTWRCTFGVSYIPTWQGSQSVKVPSLDLLAKTISLTFIHFKLTRFSFDPPHTPPIFFYIFWEKACEFASYQLRLLG